MKYKAVIITYNSKDKSYTLETTSQDGDWERSSSTKTIFPCDGMIVQMGMNFRPIRIFISEADMIESLERIYGIKPLLKK